MIPEEEIPWLKDLIEESYPYRNNSLNVNGPRRLPQPVNDLSPRKTVCYTSTAISPWAIQQ